MKAVATIAVVLALGAVGWFASSKVGESATPPGVVATVNGHLITENYVQNRMGQLPLGSQIEVREAKARFIESLVTEEALFQATLQKGLDSDPELREKVKALVGEHVIEKEVRGKIEISQARIEGYYRENESVIRGETVQVRHILLADRQACEALAETIDSLEAFEAAAAENSLDRESATRGGQLGRVMDHDAWLGFERRMFEMQEGEMQVFDGPQGCHLVRAGARETPPLPPLEAVEERIRALLTREDEIRLLRELITRIEEELVITRRSSTG